MSLHTDLTFEDLRLGSLFITHMQVENSNLMLIEAYKSALKLRINSVKFIVPGRRQFEPIQMPVCMELGSSMHIEALVSMIELRKHFNTGSSRRLLNSVHATYWCVCVVYSAESYIIFTLGCVGFVKILRVRFCHKKRASNARIFIFYSPQCNVFCSFVHSITARRILVAYGCCLCGLSMLML